MTKNYMSVVDLVLQMEHKELESAKHKYMARNAVEIVADDYKTPMKHSKIIINGDTTILITPDGKKVICRPSEGEEYDKETGIAMCIVKYLFGSRRKFLQFVDEAKDQTPECRVTQYKAK